MNLPLATTTLTVTRAVNNADPDSLIDLDSETDYSPDDITMDVIATGVRAQINAGQGTRHFAEGGEHERVLYSFRADPFDGDTIYGDDIITDALGNNYVVLWTRTRGALGISFIEGQCFQDIGAL
jgi:hypothetical protein